MSVLQNKIDFTVDYLLGSKSLPSRGAWIEIILR